MSENEGYVVAWFSIQPTTLLSQADNRIGHLRKARGNEEMDSQEKQDLLQHLGDMRRIGGDVIYYGPHVNLDEFEQLVRSVYEGDSLEIIEDFSGFQESDWQQVLSNVASKPSGILIKSDGKSLSRALRRGVVELARAKDRQQWRVARNDEPELSVIFAARTDTLTQWDEYLKQFFVWYPLN